MEKWIVSLGDGTYVLLDELPTVMLVSESTLADPNWAPPIDCTDSDHIHIRELVTDSVWREDDDNREPVHPKAYLAK